MKKEEKPTHAPNKMITMPIEGNTVGRKEANKHLYHEMESGRG